MLAVTQPAKKFPTGKFPCSQEPDTGLYPESHESTPQLPSVFTIDSKLSSHLRLGLHLLRYPDQNFVCISYFSQACYMPRRFHLPRYDHPNKIR
jgi:hypothetical protein